MYRWDYGVFQCKSGQGVQGCELLKFLMKRYPEKEIILYDVSVKYFLSIGIPEDVNPWSYFW